MTTDTLDKRHSSTGLKFRRSMSRLRPNESDSAQSILKSMLLPDEKLLQVGKISNGIYWKSTAVLLFSALFMLVVFLLGLPWQHTLLFGVFLTFKTLFMFLRAFLTKHYLLLAITDKRVIERIGIFNLEVVQLRYSKVESSEVASTIWGRLFGFSTVLISGTGGNILAVPYLENALEIRNEITEILIHRDDIEEHQ